MTTMKAPYYKLLDHTADLAVEVRGRDAVHLFTNAGMALTNLMLGCIPTDEGSPVEVSLSGRDPEDLMVRWLGEILYLFSCEGRIVSSIDVRALTSSRMEAVLKTVPFDPECHEILREIKAVTYHQIAVRPVDDHWEARVIMDV